MNFRALVAEATTDIQDFEIRAYKSLEGRRFKLQKEVWAEHLVPPTPRQAAAGRKKHRAETVRLPAGAQLLVLGQFTHKDPDKMVFGYRKRGWEYTVARVVWEKKNPLEIYVVNQIDLLLALDTPFRPAYQRLKKGGYSPPEPEEPFESVIFLERSIFQQLVEAHPDPASEFIQRFLDNYHGKRLLVTEPLNVWSHNNSYLAGAGGWVTSLEPLDSIWVWRSPHSSYSAYVQVDYQKQGEFRTTGYTTSIEAVIQCTENPFKDRLRALTAPNEPDLPLESIQEGWAEKFSTFLSKVARTLVGKTLTLTQPTWVRGNWAELPAGTEIKVVKRLAGDWFQVRIEGTPEGMTFSVRAGYLLTQTKGHPFQAMMRKFASDHDPEPEEPFESVKFRGLIEAGQDSPWLRHEQALVGRRLRVVDELRLLIPGGPTPMFGSIFLPAGEEIDVLSLKGASDMRLTTFCVRVVSTGQEGEVWAGVALAHTDNPFRKKFQAALYRQPPEPEEPFE